MERSFWPYVSKDVNDPKGCWIWTGSILKGYGRWSPKFNGISLYFRPHRLVYELWYGSIPDNFEVHHKCENKACCNPSHLEAMETGKHTTLHHKGREYIKRPYCGKGHRFTPENTRLGSQKGRYCRACDYLNNEKAKAKRRER
jgi:hypothetical protein